MRHTVALTNSADGCPGKPQSLRDLYIAQTLIATQTYCPRRQIEARGVWAAVRTRRPIHQSPFVFFLKSLIPDMRAALTDAWLTSGVRQTNLINSVHQSRSTFRRNAGILMQFHSGLLAKTGLWKPHLRTSRVGALFRNNLLRNDN